MTPDPSAAETAQGEFAAFVLAHGRGLDRLAYLLVGDTHAAEDLAADVLLAMWVQWERVRQADHPLAYVRRAMVIQAAGRFRRAGRERRGLERLRADATTNSYEPDGGAVVDVRAALLRLPARRRACLVLRLAFDLPEREVAAILGISVGTVKSQTSKAVQQFRRELGDTVTETTVVTGIRVGEPERSAPTPGEWGSHAR